MRVKLYRAARVNEAMAQIRAELGPEALILGTRRVAGGVEVTAALETSEPEPAADPGARIAAALSYHAVPSGLRQRLSGGALAATLAAAFAFAPLGLGTGAPPLLLAGPPGAGKTLTAARLATRLVMRGIAPLVISADGQRAGGAEQLAAFTRLLGLDLVTACHPVPLGRALDGRRADTPVLIDLPGSNPFNAAERDDIAAFAAAVGGSVAVVLAAGTDPAESAELAAAYREAGATHLVAGRTDHARRLGSVLTAAEAGLAITEAGTGPGAADGLTPLTPALLANWLLERAA